MAFGFPARHTETRHFQESEGVLRVAAKLALDDYGLAWEKRRDGALRAKVSMNFLSWGERLTIYIEAGSVECESRCALPTQALDWGRNKANVRKFFGYFEDALDEAAAGAI